MRPRDLRCMKFFMFLFNLLSMLVGLSVIVLCVVQMKGKKEKSEQPSSAMSRGVLSFFITLGLFLLVTNVLGCVGALKAHVKTLYVHACFFIFVVSVEFILVIGAVVFSVLLGPNNDLRVQFYRNATVEGDLVKQQAFWDNLQFEHRCCGVDGPQDYAILNREIPPSCCTRAYPLRDGGARRHLHSTCLAEQAYYMRGCEIVLAEEKSHIQTTFTWVGVVFAALEITIITLAIYMARTIRAERRKLQQNLQAHFES